MPKRISKEEKARQEIYTLKAKGAIDRNEMRRRLRKLDRESGTAKPKKRRKKKGKSRVRRILDFMTP